MVGCPARLCGVGGWADGGWGVSGVFFASPLAEGITKGLKLLDALSAVIAGQSASLGSRCHMVRWAKTGRGTGGREARGVGV